MDLYEILNLSSYVSNEFPQKFWWRSMHTHARTSRKCAQTSHKCAHTNFISCARVYNSCTCVRTRIFTKIFVGVHYWHKNLSLKFHKDPSFCCGDICKSILTFENHQLSMYFPWYDISLHQLLIKISLVLYIRHEWFSIQNDPWYIQKKVH